MTTENNISALQKLFEVCPYPTLSQFERDNFQSDQGPAYPRHIIDTVNKVRKIDSDLTLITSPFEVACLTREKEQLVEFLNSQDADELITAVENWEISERDYWPNYLGKKSAIEILALGKTSVETMTMMAKLPEDLYIKATQICVRLANTIVNVTQQAEEEIGVYADTDENGAPTVTLKKVK
jgi:hypothetical protein